MSVDTRHNPTVFTAKVTFADEVVLPNSSLLDAHAPVAGWGYEVVEQKFQKNYAQESATSCADEARVVHVARGASGTVLGVEIGAVVANIGAAVVDVDVLKNGVSILTGGTPVQIDSGDAAYAIVAGSLDAAEIAYVVGDVFEVSIDGTAGGGTLAKGVFCNLTLQELPE